MRLNLATTLRTGVAIGVSILSLVGGGLAHAKCDSGQRDIAAKIVAEARATFDDIEKLVLLKKSIKTCPGYVAWMEIGRLELELENEPDARDAFERARDVYRPRNDGTMSANAIRRQAIANSWLAEVYSDGGDLALASVATREARQGFAALTKPVPVRLLNLQAEIDDAMASADASVLARSFQLQHERATRGIGVRPIVSQATTAPEVQAQTDELEALYQGDTDAAAVASTQEIEPQAPVESHARPSTQASTESKLNIPVLFEFNSAELSNGSSGTVQQLGVAINALNLESTATVVVVGHTDSQGAADYNQTLSVRRAGAVMNAMQNLLQSPVAIQAVGRGEDELRYFGTTADDHRRNRRVEIIIRR